MNTSEVLNKAADLIEERGWTVGQAGWGQGGHSLCLEGGILAAAELGHDLPALWRCPAYRAVADYLCADGLNPITSRLGCRDLWRYNDEPTRTQAEVVEVLRACAVIEASREREAAEVTP